MKRTRFLLSLLSSCLSLALADTSFVVDGVNRDSLLESERFYDVAKGSAWKSTSSVPRKAVNTIVNAQPAGVKDFSFLGALLDFIPDEYETKVYADPAMFNNLSDDDKSCWYQVSANVMEYWQSYYGVFASKDITKNYGLSYDADYLKSFGGTQSLKIGLLFHQSFANVGSTFSQASSWYLGGNLSPDNSYGIVNYGYYNKDGAGGYFSEYFTTNASNYNSRSLESGASSATLLSYVSSALGYTQVGGNYTQTSAGQIAYISVQSAVDSKAGHALTCYGFNLDNAGNLKSLYLTNSDDWDYSLLELYVGSKDGRLMLFTDQACTQGWTYASVEAWYIQTIWNVNTPDSLKELYASYEASGNKLVWNGASTTWDGISENSTKALPDDGTGWVRYASSGNATIASGAVKSDYFNSYYDENRAVLFNDYAQSGSVSISNRIETPSIDIENSSLAYQFLGNGNTVKTDKLNKSGEAEATWSHVTLEAQSWNVEGGTLKFENATLKATSGRVQNGGRAEWSNARIEAANGVTVEQGARLQLSGTSTLVGDLVLGAGSLVEKVSGSAQLTIEGNLTIYAGANAAAVNMNTDAATFIVKGEFITLSAQDEGFIMSLSMNTNASTPECVLNANLDLTGASSITLGAGLDLNGNDLRLSSGTKIDLTMDFSGLTDSYGIAIFTNLGDVYIDDVLADAGELTALFEIPAELTEGGVYYEDGQFIVRSDIIPEPTTVTLSLLALVGLARRRRRRSS